MGCSTGNFTAPGSDSQFLFRGGSCGSSGAPQYPLLAWEGHKRVDRAATGRKPTTVRLPSSVGLLSRQITLLIHPANSGGSGLLFPLSL